MKRVVCIDDKNQWRHDLPKVKRGNIYTVIEEKQNSDSRIGLPGLYYLFAETGNSVLFHHSVFVDINDDQPDEVAIQREYSLKDHVNLSL